eukprot:4498892-Amphidinium_carterae.1
MGVQRWLSCKVACVGLGLCAPLVWCVAVIACVILLLQADPAWGFVAAWALRGIYRMQTIENIDRFPTVALNKQIALSAQ